MSADERTVFALGFAAPGAAPGERAQMGAKAFNLQRLSAAGLPVPPAFVLGTDWCAWHGEDPGAARAALRPALAKWIRLLEQACGLSFGGERKPMLVSVRSGAAASMPGMMDTLLDIGIGEGTVRGLIRLTGNPRLAWDSYRRLVRQYAEVIYGAETGPFDELATRAASRSGLAHARELDFESLAGVVGGSLALFEEMIGTRFPQDPYEQLEAAVVAVLESWQSGRAREYRRLQGIDGGAGTAVTVQRMVFGNAGGTSGSGVGFTRDPSTGENRLYLDFLFNAQGEDVVSGRHPVNDTPRLALMLPEVAARLEALRGQLEALFGDAQEFEFTVQDGRLYLLQARRAKRTPWAALRVAVEQVREGLATPAQALERLEGLVLDRLERRRVADEGAATLALAEAASIGIAAGPIALDGAACRRFLEGGEPAILVRTETSTEDIAAIAQAAGVLTALGGRTSHAAVVARQLDKVCLVGCRNLLVDEEARTIRLGERMLREGDTLCLDAERGRVLEGEPRVVVERPVEWLAEVARWREGAR